MANPYHDEAGRFASRDEMSAAVDRLEKSGDREAWMQLRIDLADADAASAKAQAEFYKAATEFATDSTRGWENIDRFSRTSTARDLTEVINKAQSSDQLEAAYSLMPQNVRNYNALLNHPALTPELEEKALTEASIGFSQDLAEKGNLTERQAAILAERSPFYKTISPLFSRLPKTKRLELANAESAYVYEQITKVGWDPDFKPAAERYLSEPDGTNFSSERYGNYGGYVVKRNRQKFVEAKMLAAEDSNENFNRAVKKGYLAVASDSFGLDTNRAGKLWDAVDIHDAEELRSVVLDNPKASPEVKAAFASAKPVLLGSDSSSKPSEELATKVITWKTTVQSFRKNERYGEDYNTARQKYDHAQAQYDSYPSTFASLERKDARYKQDFMDGKIGNDAYARIERRLANAKRFQKLAGERRALDGLAHVTPPELVQA
jgi:hypothetical protein